MTIEQRVAEGASFLDLHCVGWVDRIDLGYLRMASCTDCILGQLYHGYIEACKRLGLGDPELCTDAGAALLGFQSDFHAENATAEYQALGDAWRSLILQRRADRSSFPPAEERQRAFQKAGGR